MKPILFEADTLNYSNNGIGVLYDVIRLEVEEERNGYFGLEMEYPVDGEWFKELKDQRLILAKPNDVDEPHVFRIYEIDKNLEDGVVYILANTITDDLSGNLVIDGVVKDATAQMALNEIRTNLIEPTHFDFVSDIQTKSSSSWTRINPLQAIAGVRGSLVDLWGGEIKRTNKTLYLFSRRGKDKVATIRPGKNIDGFNMVVSTKGMITRILPFFEYSFQGLTEYEMVRDYDGNLVKQAKYTTNSSETEPTTVLGDVVVSDLADKYPVNYHEPIDFSSDEDITEKVEKFINDKEEELKNSPTIIDTTYFEDELKDYVKELVDDRASRYFTYDNPGVDKPNVEINVDILQLSDSPEWEKYKKLEHIQLTDTVEIYVRKFDVDVEVTISAIVYDSIGERVVSITAGSIQTSLSDSIKKEYEDTNLKMEQYYNSMVNGIRNTVMRTADGLNNKFTGYTEPPADISSEGDLWFKLVGEGQVEIYIYTGGKWDPVISEAVFDALEQDMEQAMIDVQDAKNRADEAYTNANIATQKAIESIGIAQEGFDAAQDALETATLSDGKAEQALTKAQEGFDKAQESFDKIDNLAIGARNLLANKSMVDSNGIVFYMSNVDLNNDKNVKSITLSKHGYVYGYDGKINILIIYEGYMDDTENPHLIDFIPNPTLPYTHTVKDRNIQFVYVGNMDEIVAGADFPLTKQQLIDAQFKLETGTVPTDWTEAPEDTDQKNSVIADDLDGLSVEVSNNKGEIASVKQTAKGLQTKVQNAEGNIANLIQTADGLQTRVTNAEGEISTVKQTAQGLQSRVETVENWEFGGRNLITLEDPTMSGVTKNGYVYRLSKTGTANPYIRIPYTLFENETDYVISFKTKKISGSVYSMAGHVESIPDTASTVIILDGNEVSKGETWSTGNRNHPDDTETHEYEIRFKTTNNVAGGGSTKYWYIQPNRSSYSSNFVLDIWDWKLEKGTKKTGWSPAPEDYEQKFTAINQDINSISTRVQTNANNYSTLTQTVSGIQTTVSNKADKSTVTQLAGVVDTKISTTDANKKFATQSQLTQTSNSLTSTITSVRNDLDNIDINPLEGGGKIFTLPLSHRTGTSTVTGVLVIKTPITSTYMTRIELSGYNYLGSNSDIDLVVSFYAYSGNRFMNYSYTSKGNYPISKVRLARDNGGRTVLIIGETNSKWSYPQIAVDKALVGYSTPPDSYKSGWSVSYLTNISAYTDVVEVSGADAQSEISSINQTVSSITTRVSNSEGKISTLTQTVNGIQTTVSNKAEKSEVTQLASTVSTKITSAQAQTLINQTTNSIVSRVETLENSTGNLVKNPELTGSHTGWSNSKHLTSAMIDFNGTQTRVLQNWQATSNQQQTYSSLFEVDPSKAYEISMWVRKSSSVGIWYLGLNAQDASGSWIGLEKINNAGTLTNSNDTNFYFVSANTASTSWTQLKGYLMPAGTDPSSMKGIGGGSSGNARMKSTTRRVRVRWLNWSSGTSNVSMYVAMPRVVEISSTSMSQISQLDNAINLRVVKGETIAQINLEAQSGTAYIGGKAIILDGDTTVNGTFRVKNANITSLTGNKITSGTINAANVNIINMNASNISTGYLNVDRLNGNISTFIQSNWNSLTSEVSITASGLKTYSNGQQTSLLNGSGHRFYRNNMFIGHIGTSNWSGDASYRGLRFGLENNADYMSWGFKSSSSASAYTTMLAWHKTGSKSNKGFTFSDDVKISGNLIATDYVSTNRLMTNFGSDSRELRLSNSTVTVGNWSSEGVSLWRGDEGGKIHWSTDSLILYGGVGRAHILLRRDNTSPLVLSSTIYNRTYSGQSTVVITSSGTLGRLSSARKYKLSIENQFRNNEEQLEHSKKMLGLNVRSWFDKAESELLAEECKQGKVLSEDTFKIKRHVGLVAEEVESAGLSEFVIYGDDGQVEGIAYEKMWIQLIPIIKNHEETISLQQQTIDNLQLKIAQMEAKGQ